MESEINNTGSRKKLFVWSSFIGLGFIVLAAVLQIIAYITYQFVQFKADYIVKDVFSEPVFYAIIGMSGIAGTFYTIARSSKGSPEYTPEVLRHLDPTITADKPADPPAESGAPQK